MQGKSILKLHCACVDWYGTSTTFARYTSGGIVCTVTRNCSWSDGWGLVLQFNFDSVPKRMYRNFVLLQLVINSSFAAVFASTDHNRVLFNRLTSFQAFQMSRNVSARMQRYVWHLRVTITIATTACPSSYPLLVLPSYFA